MDNLCLCKWINVFVNTDRMYLWTLVKFICGQGTQGSQGDVHCAPWAPSCPCPLPPSRATRGWAAHCPSSTPPPPPPPRLPLLLHSSSSSRVKPTGRWPPMAKTSRTTTRVLLLQADNLSPATSWICCDLRKVYFSLKWIVFVPLIATICEVQCLIVWSRRMVCCRELQPAHQCTPGRVQTHKSSFTFSNMDLIFNCDKLASFQRCIDLLMSKLWQLWRRAVMRVVGVNPEERDLLIPRKVYFFRKWLCILGWGWRGWESWDALLGEDLDTNNVGDDVVQQAQKQSEILTPIMPVRLQSNKQRQEAGKGFTRRLVFVVFLSFSWWSSHVPSVKFQEHYKCSKSNSISSKQSFSHLSRKR